MLQPSAIHVHEHFVTSYDDWPSPIRDFCHAALASDSAKHPSSSASELSSFLSEGLSILQRVDQPWETVRKTSLTLPFVLDSMCAQTEDTSVEWRFHANPVFMMPIDPCCFDDPNARFQPPYCTTNAIFTSAVYLESDDGCEDGELGSSDDANSSTEDEVYTPVLSDQMDVSVSVRNSQEAFLMHKDNQPVDEFGPKDTYPPSEMSVREDCVEASELDPGDVDAGLYESSEPDTEEGLTPQDHAQLLFGQAADVLEAAVACVASSADAYTVLASCLLQRHSLGLRGPLVVVVVDKYETTVSLVFGWVQPSTNNCVDVHAAHASGQVSNPGTGLFNLSHISDSARLHGVLQAIIELGHRDIDEALVRIASEGVRKVNMRWRLDLAGLTHPKDEADSEDSALERVRRWLASSSEPASSSQKSCYSTSSPLMPNTTRGSNRRSLIPVSTANSAKSTQSASPADVTAEQWTSHIERLRDKPYQPKLKALEYVNPKLLKVPASASEYAKLHSPEAWLRLLSPCQAMELGRLVIPAVFPQTAYDIECFPYLQPCAAVAAYFDPVKLPGKRSFMHDDSIFRRYQDHCDKHDQSRALMESRYLPEGDRPNRAATNITEAQKSAIENKFSWCFGSATRISHNASKFDWNATGETEGRGIGGWDAIQVLGLLHEDDSDDVELSVRFEKQIQIPQHDAYLDKVKNANRVFRFSQEEEEIYESCVEMIPAEPPEGKDLSALPAGLQNTGLSQNDIANFVASQAQAAARIVELFDEWRKQLSAWRAVGFESMLCRIREEPSRARCDVVAALRIRDVFEEGEVNRVQRFNVLCEGQEPQTQPDDARLDMARALAYRDTMAKEQKAGPCRFTGRLGRVQLTRVIAESAVAEDHDTLEEGTEIVEGALEVGKITLAGVGASGGGDARLSESTLGRWNQVDQGARGRQEHALTSSTTARAGSVPRSSPSSRSITLGVYSAENKVADKDFGQCTYQGVMNTLAGIKQLAAVGIREFPVFCSVIDGRTAHVLCGWSAAKDKQPDLPSREGLAKPVVVYMSYWDTPTYDLADPMETLRFCGFLLHIRYVHVPRLRREFEKVRQDFMKRWKDGSDELNWTLDEQKRVIDDHLAALEKKIKEALSEIRSSTQQASSQAASSKASHTASSKASSSKASQTASSTKASQAASSKASQTASSTKVPKVPSTRSSKASSSRK